LVESTSTGLCEKDPLENNDFEPNLTVEACDNPGRDTVDPVVLPYPARTGRLEFEVRHQINVQGHSEEFR